MKQMYSSAVFRKKAVTAKFAKNEMTQLYGSPHHYLTVCQAKTPYLHSKVVKTVQ